MKMSSRKKFALRSLRKLVERLPSKKKNSSSLTTTNKWRGRKSESKFKWTFNTIFEWEKHAIKCLIFSLSLYLFNTVCNTDTSSGGRPSRLSPESKCLRRKLLRKTTFHQRSGKDRAPISHKDVSTFFTNRGTRKNTSHLQEIISVYLGN